MYHLAIKPTSATDTYMVLNSEPYTTRGRANMALSWQKKLGYNDLVYEIVTTAELRKIMTAGGLRQGAYTTEAYQELKNTLTAGAHNATQHGTAA